jgi:hypothetical protein
LFKRLLGRLTRKLEMANNFYRFNFTRPNEDITHEDQNLFLRCASKSTGLHLELYFTELSTIKAFEIAARNIREHLEGKILHQKRKIGGIGNVVE